MQIVVVGGGKVGYYLTKTLIEHHHTPTLVELDKATCQRIANELDIPVICGDGTRLDVLDSLELDKAEALIAVTRKDQDNLLACQLAKRLYHVPRTVARINNPKNAPVMKKLGVDIPISATDNIAHLLEREVDTAAIKQLMPLNRGKASLSELELPEDFRKNGARLMDLDLPVNCVLVSVTRDGEMLIPRGNTQLYAKDKLLVVCENEALGLLSEKLGLEDESHA